MTLPSVVAGRISRRDAVFQHAPPEKGKEISTTAPFREHYHENYYAAFVGDPDGNNVEAVCHKPA